MILPPERQMASLSHETTPEALSGLLVPHSAGQMKAYPVSTNVICPGTRTAVSFNRLAWIDAGCSLHPIDILAQRLMFTSAPAKPALATGTNRWSFFVGGFQR